MELDIRTFVGLGGIPLVQAIVAALKTTIPNLPARYYPAVSIVVGEAINVGLAYMLNIDLRTAVVIGVVTGLAASGLFDYGKTRERLSQTDHAYDEFGKAVK